MTAATQATESNVHI